jgi:hypothetical protein
MEKLANLFDDGPAEIHHIWEKRKD